MQNTNQNTNTNANHSVQPASPAEIVIPTGRLRYDGLAQINTPDAWNPAAEHYGKQWEQSLDAPQYVTARGLHAPEDQVFIVSRPDNESSWRAAYAALDTTGKFPSLIEYPRSRRELEKQRRAKQSILTAIDQGIEMSLNCNYRPASAVADIVFRNVQRRADGQFTHIVNGTAVVFSSKDVMAAMQQAIVNEALDRIRRTLLQFGFQPYGCLIVGAVVTTAFYSTVYGEDELYLSVFNQADFAPGLTIFISIQGGL